MNIYAFYSVNGEITNIYTGTQPEMQTGFAYINCGIEVNDTLYYIPDTASPVPTAKPTNPTTIDKTTVIADGVDKITLSSIPLNSTIDLTGDHISPIQDTATSSTIDFTFDVTGTYNLKVDLFPYLPFEAVINAN